MESIVHRRENVVLMLLWVLQRKSKQDHRLTDANAEAFEMYAFSLQSSI